MPSTHDQPAVPARIRALAGAGGLLALGMAGAIVVLLVLVLGTMNHLSDQIEQTNSGLSGTSRQIASLHRELNPLAERGPSFFRTGRTDLRAVRDQVATVTLRQMPAVRDAAQALASALLPVLPELDAAARSAGALLRGHPVGDAIDRADALLRSHPVGGTIDRADAVLKRMQAIGLMGDASTALRAVPDLQHSLRILRSRFNDSLTVQCILLDHIVSLDRKTGGPVPPATHTQTPPAECRDRHGG